MSSRVSRVSLSMVLLGLVAVTAACGEDRQQSALSPRGTAAESIEPHWQTMLWIGVAVWVVVTAAVIVALVRRRKDAQERRVSAVVVLAGAVVPGLIVAFVAVQSIGVLRDIDARDSGDGLVVEVTGHRYWWEVRYPDQEVTTANELHIPVGEQVQLQVTSSDVIHSIWAPSLNGKVDLIPGQSNTTWLETQEPGTYLGQCAEFCGLQHAQMRFRVVAHEPDDFDTWLADQQRPAVDPSNEAADPLVREGQQVFMSSSCVYCHTIEGTAAQGRVGPDLTHLASRDTIAAGLLPNTRGDLAGWIVDPQAIKPGNQMPGTDLSGDELQALLAYLESLE
jgi:cytochrome c oxidase subunit 2